MRTAENRQQRTETRNRSSLLQAAALPVGRQRGFTLLIAVLVASLMLVLAGSMFNLVQKELILSSLGKDSQFAFYTADSALECALYWDFREQAFEDPAGGEPIVCSGITIGPVSYPGLEIPMEYQYDLGGNCAKVTVTKYAEYPRTSIEARGYNTTCGNLSGNLRALERAVQVNY